MSDERADGWDESAAAWISEIGDFGDYGRAFVLDRAMLGRIEGRGFVTALDVGCGEGRFCRMIQARGLRTVGIDPTRALIERASLSTYLTVLLDHHLRLRHFAEPAPSGGDPERAERYRRVPYFHLMEWEKPAK